jgi:hypothetical protein
VLAGRTKGYRSHPQLRRFRETPEPLAAVGAYLAGVADEAQARGYRYDRGLINCAPAPGVWDRRIDVSTGQLEYEWAHLVAKLAARSPDWLAALSTEAPTATAVCTPHPLFHVVEGPVAEWEVV